MTKADITEAVSSKCSMQKKESFEIVESIFSLMKECLEKGEDLKISGFGKFEVKSKKPRRGRNPQTGESIILDARQVLTFKPSQILRDLVNGQAS